MIPLNVIVTDKAMPEQYLSYLQSLNPAFQIHYFSDEDCRILIKKYFPPVVLQAYDKIKPGAYKADLFRYCVLQVLGGVYTDTNVPYGQSFSQFWDLSANKVYLVKDAQPDAIQVATMASPKNSSFMSLCMKKAVYNILHNHYGQNPFSITGPEMAGECFKKYTAQSEVTLGEFPCEVEGEANIQIDYELVKTNHKLRHTVTEAVYLDKNRQFVCAYKGNEHRNHRNSASYYWHAWTNRNVYGEKELVSS
jgi:hypothetical protein